MPEKFALRLQSKFGRFQLRTLSLHSTLIELQQTIEEKTNLETDQQKILVGYPPKEIASYDPSTSLRTLNIRSGDTLTVDEVTATSKRRRQGREGKEKEPSSHNKTCGLSSSQETTESSPGEERAAIVTSAGVRHSESPPEAASQLSEMGNQLFGNGKLSRRVVPADNSCLFRSISVLLCGDREPCDELRNLVAGLILSNSSEFNSALLGKENSEYVRWLQRKESWGGAIELMVFSEHFQVELDVMDVQTLRIDRFGEDKGYSMRSFLLYDGIHYDPLIRSTMGGALIQGKFPVSDMLIEKEAKQIARIAHEGMQFTDLSNFSLRCLVCNKLLRGQTDALAHATLTGHSNFGEISSKT